MTDAVQQETGALPEAIGRQLESLPAGSAQRTDGDQLTEERRIASRVTQEHWRWAHQRLPHSDLESRAQNPNVDAEPVQGKRLSATGSTVTARQLELGRQAGRRDDSPAIGVAGHDGNQEERQNDQWQQSEEPAVPGSRRTDHRAASRWALRSVGGGIPRHQRHANHGQRAAAPGTMSRRKPSDPDFAAASILPMPSQTKKSAKSKPTAA
jgi:hypothetical protein